MTDFDPSFSWKLSAVPRLDWPNNVIARQNQPPATAATNDCYIVGEHPTAEWRERRNQIAVRNSEGAWIYLQPARGRRAYVATLKQHLEFTGKKWVLETTPALPPGGLTGYVLKKNTDADYDAVWGLVAGGGGGGSPQVRLVQNSELVTGTDPEGTLVIVLGQGLGAYPQRGQIYERIGSAWVSRGYISQFGIPEGGSSGQVLAKTSGSNFAVSWVDPDAAGGDITSVVAGTGLGGGGTTGDVTLAVLYGTSSTTACVGNDSRLSNDRTASGIRSSSTVVAVSSATAPIAGQVLMATSSTAATWQDVAGGGTITAVNAGTGLTGGGSSGSVSLAADFGTTSGKIAQGNDSRLTDDRTASGIRTASTVVSVASATAPTSGQVLTATSGSAAQWSTPSGTSGSAGGDLAGTYPNPTVAAIHSSSTQLTIGTIVDGEFLQRSGTTIASAAGTSAPQPVQVNGSLVGTRNAIDIVAGTGVTVSGTDDSGANRVRVTVNATGSNPQTDPWYVIHTSGSDDTTAIQAAFDAILTAGRDATVYFPDADYPIGGALQDTSRSNAQLLLPRRMVDSSTQPFTIRLLGPSRPAGQVWVAGTSTLPTSSTVIRGTVNTGGGSLIGAWGPSGSFSNFTGIRVVIENLTFRMPANPTKTCLDLSHVEEVSLDGVRIDASANATDSISSQSTSTSWGLRLPQNSNGASSDLGRVDVIGYYNGVEIGEHARIAHLGVWGCRTATSFTTADHASHISRRLVVNCNIGISFAGDHTTRIEQFDAEHDNAGTWVPTYDISDPSNHARGSLNWHTVLSGTGATNTFLVNGALYIKRAHLYYSALVFTLTDAGTVTIDCSIADHFRWTIGGNRTFANPINPHDAQVINVRIKQDATGGRTWTLGSKFKFPGGAPTLSAAANTVDFLSCQYDAAADTWACSLIKALS